MRKTTTSERVTVDDVTAMFKQWSGEMDVDATISSSHNRRTVNMQLIPDRDVSLDTTEKSLEGSSTFGAELPPITATQRIFTLPLILYYVEHRAVLQSYAQKLATRALEWASPNESDVNTRIVSKMEGVLATLRKNQTVT